MGTDSGKGEANTGLALVLRLPTAVKPAENTAVQFTGGERCWEWLHDVELEMMPRSAGLQAPAPAANTKHCQLFISYLPHGLVKREQFHPTHSVHISGGRREGVSATHNNFTTV